MLRSPAIIVALGCILAGCGGKPPAAGPPGGMPPLPVGVATPIVRELPTVREQTGRIESVDLVELRPQVSGVVTRIAVADGAEVAAGQVLVEIDPIPFQAEAARAEAEVARANAQLDLARLDRERSRQMLAQQAIAQAAVDEADAAVRVAEAQLAAAQAQRTTAYLDLERATIKAPMAGRLGRILTTPGNLVQSSGATPGTLLATLASVDPVEAVFDLDEESFHRISERLYASARGGATAPVTVSLAGDGGEPLTGRVSFVDNRIDPASGAIQIRATIADPTRRATPGSFCRVRIELSAPRRVLLINERAVMSQVATRYVYTVDDKGITGFRPVKLGAVVGQLRVVESGLGPEDRIAVNNLAKIFFPGMPVGAVPASMETTLNLDPAAPAAGGPATAAAR